MNSLARAAGVQPTDDDQGAGGAKNSASGGSPEGAVAQSHTELSVGSAESLAGNLPSVVFKGFELGEESGESPVPGRGDNRSSADRHDDLGSLLRGGRWLDSDEAAPGAAKRQARLPRAGEEVLGFRLLRELGRGAFARVFLAEQTSLANRRVAVKISIAHRDESQTLAQLQHTHIVPIYSAHIDSASGLRILVMPYFGGTTLDRLLAKTGLKLDRHISGRSLITALDDLTLADFAERRPGSMHGLPSQPWSASQVPSVSGLAHSQPGAPVLTTHPSRGFFSSNRDSTANRNIGRPARNILERSSYIHAVTWIAARLAEGLAHAHQRGILHRDIKPSNVLIASDGQPMLLDFNLARDLKSPDSGTVAYVGGTLPYMAPEHLDAFNVQNATPPTAVDERSDIYSLGVVLFEMLSHKHPFPIAPGDSLPAMLDRMSAERRATVPAPRDANPAVPRSLDAIVRRCLDPVPARRYPEASQLAEDLQRELDSMPLAHTSEPSLAERMRKWMHRHPRLSSGGSIAAIGIAFIAALVYLVLVVGGKLAGYDAERRWIKFQEGLVRAQLLVHTGSEPSQNLAEGRQVCEQALGLFDILNDEQWQRRSRVMRLAPDSRARLREDATELAILLARVWAEQAKLAKPAREQNALLAAAVRLLDRAEHFQSGDTPRALFEDRGTYRSQLGDVAGADADWSRAEAMPVRTARDHYLRATSLALQKRYDQAIRELTAATRIDPKHFWAHFELGICYYELGYFEMAAASYNVCEAIWRDCAWTNLNRAMAYSRLERWDEAIADYSAAIRKDARFSEAYLNRGIAQLRRHRYQEAVEDLSRAIELGRRSGDVWAARATALAGLGQWDQARLDFDSALFVTPGDETILFSRGFALARHAPEQALSDFNRLLERNPDSSKAHYGRAFALSEMPGQTPQAIEAARAALAADSQSIPARCALAVLLARVEDYNAAIAEIQPVLEQSPTGFVHYAAASVYALASQRDPHHSHRALELLQQALRQDYGTSEIENDPDLEPLSQYPQFQIIKDSVRSKR